jgi:NDP-sugar pyrophosphorylase family protein
MTPGIQHAVIMAAGRGRRMMPITNRIPKAMAPYRDSTLIAHGITMIARHVQNVHVTVGYRGAMLAEHVITHGARTVFNTEGHGNAWWLYNTFLSLLDEPVCVLTCDNVMELDFARLEDEYFETGMPACLLVPVIPVAGLEGDYIFHNDNVVTRISRTDPAPTYCSGIQIVNPVKVRELTSAVEDFNDLWGQLIISRELRVASVYPDRWFSADTADQLAVLSERDR